MSYQIIVRYPNGQVLTFPFTGTEITCGRADENQIRLAHSFVSSRHVKIEREGNAFQVRDLNDPGNAVFDWRGARNFVHLDPRKSPGHIFQIRLD